MTHKIFTLLILATMAFSSCSDSVENSEKTNSDENTEKIDYDTTTGETVVTEKQMDNEVEKVYRSAIGLIKWYIENRDSLLAKRERIVQVDDKNYFYIDTLFLEEYLNFVNSEGANYFSNIFIKAERKFWEKAGNETKKNPVIHEEIFNPWSFDYDPIFNGHEWPKTYKEWKEDWGGDIDKKSIKINRNIASFTFEIQRFMIKEGDLWKLKNW